MGQPPDALNFDALEAQLNVLGDSKPAFGAPTQPPMPDLNFDLPPMQPPVQPQVYNPTQPTMPTMPTIPQTMPAKQTVVTQGKGDMTS